MQRITSVVSVSVADGLPFSSYVDRMMSSSSCVTNPMRGDGGVRRPTHPSTCYAQRLGRCSPGLSGEHYLSAGILRLIGRAPIVEGMPGVPGGKRYPVKSLATRILCQRHNHLLSPLDASAIRFFEAVRRFDSELGDATVPVVADSVVVDGDHLERWLLKVAFGLAAARRRSKQQGSVREEHRMLRVLFGDQLWPKSWGMYMAAPPGTQLAASGDLEVVTGVMPRTQEIRSLTAACLFLPLTMTLGQPDRLDPATHRPRALRMDRTGDPGVKSVQLTWTDHQKHAPCTFTRTGSMDGWAP